jgi:hypothetical protein
MRYCPTFSESQLQQFRTNYVERGPDDCWLWTGRLEHGIYPQWEYAPGKRIFARKLLASLHGLPWARIRIACGNTLCVNPNHFGRKTGLIYVATSERGRAAEAYLHERASVYAPLVVAWSKFLTQAEIAKRLDISMQEFRKYFGEVFDNTKKRGMIVV